MHPNDCGARTVGYMSLVCGLIATSTLLLAVSTDFWLYATEWINPNTVPNIDSSGNETFTQTSSDKDTHTHDYSDLTELTDLADLEEEEEAEKEDEEEEDSYDDPLDNSYFDISVKIVSHSGLWRTCVVIPHGTANCANIVYSGQDVDRTETTNSINRAIRKSAPVIVGSLVVMVVALALSIIGSRHHDVRNLLAATFYIASALFLAVGVILYISSVNDEVSHRRKSATGEQEGFEYKYGWAFFFNGISFIGSMVAAVNNITLYLMKPNPPKRPNFIASQHQHPERNFLVMSPSETINRDMENRGESMSELDSPGSKETDKMDKPYFNTITPV